MSNFRVSHIDHVEVFVADRYAAAQWYEQVFGLTILRDFAGWAEDPRGPLMISSDGGHTKLALFQGDPPQAGAQSRFRVAFQVDSAGFLAFIERLDTLELVHHSGERLSSAHVVDHEKSWSLYFNDPYGNPFEITTYEYDAVRKKLIAG